MLPPLPREHGTWAWLLVPLVAGGAAGGTVNPPLLLLALASLAAFLGRASLASVGKGPRHRPGGVLWTVIFALASLLSLAALLVYYHRWVLLPLGAVGVAAILPVVVSRDLRYRWRALGQLLLVSGLSTLAPAAYCAAVGRFDGQAAAAWLPPALHGGASVFYIRMLFGQRRAGASRSVHSSDRGMAAYLVLLWAVVGAAVLARVVPALVVAAMVPLTVKIVLALVRRTAVGDVRRTGTVEALHAAVFAGLLVMAYAVG